MTEQVRFVTLDVFTSKPYAGNPLAVVFLPDSIKSGLTQEQKQSIAREVTCQRPSLSTPTSRRNAVSTTTNQNNGHAEVNAGPLIIRFEEIFLRRPGPTAKHDYVAPQRKLREIAEKGWRKWYWRYTPRHLNGNQLVHGVQLTGADAAEYLRQNKDK